MCPSLSYCHSDAHSLHLSECLSPSLFIELRNSPMQNTMHLHRQASYQSEFPCLPTSTRLWECQVNRPTHYTPPDLKITKLLSMNCTSNCFRTHPILQIWPPVTTGRLWTSNECSSKRDVSLMKK